MEWRLGGLGRCKVDGVVCRDYQLVSQLLLYFLSTGSGAVAGEGFVAPALVRRCNCDGEISLGGDPGREMVRDSRYTTTPHFRTCWKTLRIQPQSLICPSRHSIFLERIFLHIL